LFATAAHDNRKPAKKIRICPTTSRSSGWSFVLIGIRLPVDAAVHRGGGVGMRRMRMEIMLLLLVVLMQLL